MPDINPFRFSGPLDPAEMIDREVEAGELLSLAQGGHSVRLVGPRRYGKTTLLQKVLDNAEQTGMATVLVDLEDVLSLGGVVVRVERAYARRLQGPLRCRAAAPGSARRCSATRTRTSRRCCCGCSTSRASCTSAQARAV